MFRLSHALLLGLFLCLPVASAVAQPRGFTADDLVRLDRVSSLALSPDGTRVVFVLRETDMEADKGRTDLWIMNADGTGIRRLTTDPANDSGPVWAPDGSSIYFLSTRSGSSQVWRVEPDGGAVQAVSDLPLDVGHLKVAPDGASLVFSLEVFVDCPDLTCSADRLNAKTPTSGVVYDRIFVRHWDTWKDGRRRHLFRAPLNDGTLGEAVDLMPGMDADAPTKPWGGTAEVAFAPGGGVVFTARDMGAAEPWSTNADLFYVSQTGASPVNLTAANEAWDGTPVFSPDGRSLAWLAMSVPGYEADRFRILRAAWQDGSMGNPVEVAPDWDRSPGSLAFSSDGSVLLAHAKHVGHQGLFAIDADDGAVTPLLVDGSAGGEVEQGGRVFFTRESFATPADIWAVGLDGADARQLSSFNEERLAGVDMGVSEQFSFEGANGDEVFAWMVGPANFDAGKKYPVAFLIHGGPQGSFGSSFHYRWNPQTYAGAGYAVVMVDFHGSTGYGQEFCDSIQNNWGGWPLEDLQAGLAEALRRYEWMDGERVAALGASYGGYMVNWIAGNWSDRFTCLVNHDGLFDLQSMYYSTEELWFPEREFLGAPHENREAYDRWSPSRYVQNWQTPMLVIHGEKDLRVPVTEGLATFTALQRRGIASRLLYYPDENHWVLKPHNSVQWHAVVLDWLDRWTKHPGDAR